MKRSKSTIARLFCFVLICLLAGNGYAGSNTMQEVKASSYQDWKQSDSAWGSKKVGTNGTMAKWGCKITAIAMLMVKSSVEDETDFNPGVLLERYESGNFITHSSITSEDGNLYYSAVSQANSPQFYLEGSRVLTGTSFSYTRSVIASLEEQGYYMEIRVKNDRHSVAVNYCSDDEVYIMDPGYNRTKLSTWSGTITKVNYYKACPGATGIDEVENNENGLDSDELAVKNFNYPTTLALGNVFSVKGTVTSSSSKLTKVVVGVYTKAGKMVIGKSVAPSAKTYSIKKLDSYIKFGTLSTGTYYYKVKATNSTGTSILVNKKFIVS